MKSPGLRCPSTFHKLPEGTLENLTEEQKLAIVSRHFVTGVTVLTADITNYHSTSVETFGGEKITLIRRRDMVFISYMGDYYPVITPDVMASNGVIHVIDKGAKYLGFFSSRSLKTKEKCKGGFFSESPIRFSDLQI